MSNRYYQGPPTDHFDGKRFFHPSLPSSDKSVREILRWKFSGNKKTLWPKTVLAQVGIRPEPAVEGLRITHIGHASYLIQTANQNILVDPVWSNRASPVSFAGPRRHNPPAVALEDLPPIHAVLITHNHYDHMDLATLKRLWHKHQNRLITPLGNDVVIRAALSQAQIQTGDWWDAFSLSEQIRLTIVPAYHWSTRGLTDKRMALWGGFILETAAGNIYCAGDTAYRDGAIFKQIGQRFAPITVAILPIGAYAPRWFMQTQHADPHEAVQIALDCGAKQVLGIHWGTFDLTDEPFDEPPQLLAAALAQSINPIQVQAVRPGDTWSP